MVRSKTSAEPWTTRLVEEHIYLIALSDLPSFTCKLQEVMGQLHVSVIRPVVALWLGGCSLGKLAKGNDDILNIKGWG